MRAVFVFSLAIFFSFGTTKAHEPFTVTFGIVTKSVLIDTANTDFSKVDTKCILNDSTCALVLKVNNTETTPETFTVMADSEDDAKMAGIKRCKVKYLEIEEIKGDDQSNYLIRQFVYQYSE